ncbi:MAG: beta-lactamase family protein [Maribacter sp.]|nr:beta-lactamase family protein [Maribacter sp.]
MQINPNNNLPVLRLKFLAGAMIVISALFALAKSVGNPISASESENAISIDLSKNNLVDLKKAALYKLQQQELKTALQAYFDQAIASGDIVGAGVSIVRGDSIVISDGFGKRNIETNEGVDGQTVFRLGSLSKGFAGILAADLVNEGELHWEDKVSDYIPEFHLGERSAIDKITLANILSHTSGAPYHSYTNLVEAGLPLTDIAKRFRDVQPISDPGLSYSYQNALFALSGEMFYKATGQDIKTLLENKLFKPLQMCSTTMDHENLMHAENVAIPYSKRLNKWNPKQITNHYDNAIAAGGINSSALDMAKWMRLLLGHSPEIMAKSVLEEAFNPFIEIKGHHKYYQRWPGHIATYYGFGWRIHKFVEDDSHQEKTIWHHGGSVNGYRNEIAIYPNADLGICVLLNNNSNIAKTVIPDLYKIVQNVYNQNARQIALNNSPKTTPHL